MPGKTKESSEKATVLKGPEGMHSYLPALLSHVELHQFQLKTLS